MTRIFLLGILTVAVAGCSDRILAPASNGARVPMQPSLSKAPGAPIPGRYIVVFRKSVLDVDAEAKAMGHRHAGAVVRTFKSAIHGMTVDLSDAEVTALRAEPNVAYVEQDRTLSIDGARFDAPLVSALSNQCLTTTGGTATITSTTVGACTGSLAQSINLPSTGSAGQILLFGGAYCLDAWGGGGHVGDVIGTYTCNGGSNQSWTLTTGGALVGVNGLCVAVSGSNVTLQSCDGSSAQRWSTTTPGARFDAPLVSVASGMCLTTMGGSPTATSTALTACTGASGQTLNLPATGSTGQVLMFSGAYCLDAYGGGGNVGDVIGTWSCHGGANQNWTLTQAGALVGINGLCVTATGTAVSLQICAGGVAQRWSTSATMPTQPPAPAPSPVPAPPPASRFDAPLVNALSNLCLTTAGGSATITSTTVVACTGATGQVLNLPPIGTAGRVLLFSGGYCLDAWGGGGHVGDVIGTYTCNGGSNQSWTLTAGGALVGVNGLCAAVTGSGVTLQSCDGSAAERWNTVAVAPAPAPAPTATQTGAPWGLDRIDQRALPLNGSYSYQRSGSGVTAYIIDTGINFTHDEFGGRASSGVDQITSGGKAGDCNGHGSHVAGTVGGTTYGVAKQVRLVAVRVLDCNGSGSTSGVIAGIDWVTANRVLPAVANMSLGGDFSQALNDAVEQSIAAGVVYAVAAGNSTANACSTSPASAPNAITVGATDASDTFASFSNYGGCVKLNAPGVNITSAWIGSNSATASASGTSMASPHVTGAAALYLQQYPSATPAQVRAALVGSATTGTIKSLGSGTVNLLLYTGPQ